MCLNFCYIPIKSMHYKIIFKVRNNPSNVKKISNLYTDSKAFQEIANHNVF